ncbi:MULTISPECIES: hypothetical protein [unclassified Kitasatospora]|uniref:hypothetical protein n=1 Tax=unclassified Kitasatospora TaxID=2633591 RepID=UPI00070B12E7|nr:MULTISPECIES: hypothetical protein [unclassified Kitasatospora]KQV09932.1 hypothetical protein ASC99_11065 [Kitasatospora sp. Root107]KRB70172.1 hypothetical protein ASE03_26420 [Kitasatospora sp. Root187]
MAGSPDFPPSYLLMYGAFFSAVFAFVFMPVAMQWRSVTVQLVNSVAPVPEAANLDDKWLARRSHLTTFLRLDLSLPKLLAPALGILAPLATSALSLVLPSS